MNERFLTRYAVILRLISNKEKGEEILLQRRQNTGYMDGFYDLSASCHVEKNEQMTTSLIRETK